MRRSVLLIGVVTALAVGGAAGVYIKGDKVERQRTHHINVVRNNALCEKSLEIAASFSTYAKDDKLAQSIVMTNSWFSEALNGNLRAQAYELGFTRWEYDAILGKAREEAELNLIPQINGAPDPAAKAHEIAQTCVPWPLDHYVDSAD